MPLAVGKEVFKTSYKAYLQTLANNTDEDKDNTIDEHVNTLADLIEAYIQTATVNVVAVQPGAGTATGTLL